MLEHVTIGADDTFIDLGSGKTCEQYGSILTRASSYAWRWWVAVEVTLMVKSKKRFSVLHQCPYSWIWTKPRWYQRAGATVYRGVPQQSGMLDFRYFEIRKYSIFWFHQIKHYLLKKEWYQDHLIWFGSIDSTTISWSIVIYKFC